jgi:hypothetical protein
VIEAEDVFTNKALRRMMRVCYGSGHKITSG